MKDNSVMTIISTPEELYSTIRHWMGRYHHNLYRQKLINDLTHDLWIRMSSQLIWPEAYIKIQVWRYPVRRQGNIYGRKVDWVSREILSDWEFGDPVSWDKEYEFPVPPLALAPPYGRSVKIKIDFVIGESRCFNTISDAARHLGVGSRNTIYKIMNGSVTNRYRNRKLSHVKSITRL